MLKNFLNLPTKLCSKLKPTPSPLLKQKFFSWLKSLSQTTLTFIVALTFLLFFTSTQVLAHRVNVFAWLEGKSIVVKGSFSRSHPAKGAAVKVFTGTNKKLLVNGQTNAEGLWTFQTPSEAQTEGLLIELNAGSGHQNTWSMGPSEFQTLSAKETKQVESQQSPKTSLETSAAKPEVPDLPLEALRATLREELNLALRPIKIQLLKAENPEPGLKEIVGGLGWLAGIFAVLLLYKVRQRNPKN